MIEKNAIEPADLKSPGYYSVIFVVPKYSGDWKPVIDLSSLNPHVKTPKFAIRLALPRKSWVVSLDLKDAFFHIPINPSSRR